MRCHFICDKKAGKVWIPGCYSGIYSEGHCLCRIEENERAKKWKEDQPEFKLKKENNELWKENARLHRLILKLTKK